MDVFWMELTDVRVGCEYFQKFLTPEAKTAVPHVAMVVEPPRCANIVISQEIIGPCLGIQDKTIVLYHEYMFGIYICVQILDHEARVLLYRIDIAMEYFYSLRIADALRTDLCYDFLIRKIEIMPTDIKDILETSVLMVYPYERDGFESFFVHRDLLSVYAKMKNQVT